MRFFKPNDQFLIKVLEREEDPAVQLPAPVMGSITISPRAGEPRVFDLVLSGYGNASNIEWLVDGRLIASSSPTAVCELPASGVHTVTCRLTGLDGSVLTKSGGVNQGPSGKETYYNLDMSGVIRIMQNQGYDYEYWVREDGVKMYGDYIMCAANLNVHPRGSLVESSLGTCIVCDTGGFASGNPNQLDIAVTW